MSDLVQAWLDCRKAKRNTASALTFEREVERTPPRAAINAGGTGATANQESACGLRIAGAVMPAKVQFLRTTRQQRMTPLLHNAASSADAKRSAGM